MLLINSRLNTQLLMYSYLHKTKHDNNKKKLTSWHTKAKRKFDSRLIFFNAHKSTTSGWPRSHEVFVGQTWEKYC